MVFTIAALLFFSCGKDTGMDTPPALPAASVSNVTLFEGNDKTVFPFKVTLDKAGSSDITMRYETRDLTAVAGTDYIAKSGTLTIPANTREAVIEIVVTGDTVKQADKQFQLVLSNPVNATLASPTGTGTIRNDDTFMVTSGDGYSTPETYAGYEKLWSDEFNGAAIDSSIWSYDIGGGGWGNNELQYYTNRTDNARINNGNLVIEARREDFGGRNYTSARLITKNKKFFTFGRVDIRARLPKGKGIWPALWMLGQKIDQTGWPNCGEIDIMEVIGSDPARVHGTIHYGPQGASQSTQKTASYVLPKGDFSDQYHVFSLIWSADNMTILVDDNPYFATNRAAVGSIYPFNEPFFMLCNVAVGGNWPGSPDATTVFPQQMTVDYIRVFKKL